MLGEGLQDVGAEAADGAFLDRHQHFVVPHKTLQQFDVERLGKAGICDRGRQAKGLELLGRRQTFPEPAAI